MVKESFEPILLRKKKKKKKNQTGFSLFKNIFLRNRSLSNARSIYRKNAKLEREIYIQLKID